MIYTDLAECVIVPGCRLLRVCKINWAVFWEHGLVKWRKSQPVLWKEKKKKKKEKKNVKKEKIRYIMFSGCPARPGNNIIWDNSTRNKYNAEKGRKKAKNEVCYIRHRCPHVSPRNFAVLLNIFWRKIVWYPPTKYWRRLSSVRHGDVQRSQKLKAPLETKPTQKNYLYQLF